MSCRTTLTAVATIAGPLCALRASTTRIALVREVHVFSNTVPTTSGAIGLIRSTALGTGTITSVAPVARSPNAQAAGAILVTNWATAAPTNGGAGSIFRRWTQSVALGNGIIWTFDQEPFQVPLGNTATGELIVCNTIATNPGALDVTFVFEE